MTTEEMFSQILEILKRIEARQISGLSEISEIKEATPVQGSFASSNLGS